MAPPATAASPAAAQDYTVGISGTAEQYQLFVTYLNIAREEFRKKKFDGARIYDYSTRALKELFKAPNHISDWGIVKQAFIYRTLGSTLVRKKSAKSYNTVLSIDPDYRPSGKLAKYLMPVHKYAVSGDMASTAELHIEALPATANALINGHRYDLPGTFSNLRPAYYFIRVTADGCEPYDTMISMNGERKSMLVKLKIVDQAMIAAVGYDSFQDEDDLLADESEDEAAQPNPPRRKKTAAEKRKKKPAKVTAQQPGKGEKAKGKEPKIYDASKLTLLFFRADIYPPKDELIPLWENMMFLQMMLGIQSKTWDFNGFHLSLHGGFSSLMILAKSTGGGDDSSMEAQIAFWNFMFGLQGGYKSYIQLNASVSANVASFHGDLEGNDAMYDFDMATIGITSPFIGTFAEFKYDVGTNTARNFEMGYAHSFMKKGFGVLSVGFATRFGYPITGTFLKYDGRFPTFLSKDKVVVIQDSGQVIENPEDYVEGDMDFHYQFDVKRDYSGFAKWERVSPFGKAKWFQYGLGLSLGSVPDAVRFAFLEVGGVVKQKYLIFLRGSNSWSRIEQTRYWGAALGAEMPIAKNAAFVRFGIGYRDYENVDRYGDPGLLIGSVSISTTF